MDLSKEKILQALSNVEDPDLKKDLVTLNMIRDLEVKGKEVKFTLVLTTPACPMKDMLTRACQNAIIHLVDAEAKVDINVTAQMQGQAQGPQVGGNIKNIIAVASGKGGVGKSTVAANLALALSTSGAKVGLIDADIHGPSIPTMFGLVGAKPKGEMHEGKQYMKPLERYGIQVLSIGFFTQGNQAVPWRGPMVSSALKQFLQDAWWDEIDYLIVDLPPGTGDIHLTLLQQFPVTGAIIVTTPQELALSDCRKAIQMFGMKGIEKPVLGVVENMSWFSPLEDPEKKYFLFGKGGGEVLAREFKLPLMAQIPLIQGAHEDSDQGKPSVLRADSPLKAVFMDLAGEVAMAVSRANAQQAQAKPVPLS